MNDERTVADYNLHGLVRPVYLVQGKPTVSFEGTWKQGQLSHIIVGNGIHWQSGSTTKFEETNR